MEDAGGPSSKKNYTPEEHQHYEALQTHLETLLPFVNKIIDNGEQLRIRPFKVSKLRLMCNMVAAKRLKPRRLKVYKNVFHALYKLCGTQLNYYLPPDFQTSWMPETKLNDEGNNISSNARCTSNKSNQNQNSESKLSNKIPGTSYENMVNHQMGCLEVLTPNNENTVDKNFANVEIGASSCSKNAREKMEIEGENSQNKIGIKNNCTANLDKHIKRSESCNSDISSNDKQTNNKQKKFQKTKKPFSGPLSVKLAREKMEMERNNSQNKREIKKLERDQNLLMVLIKKEN